MHTPEGRDTGRRVADAVADAIRTAILTAQVDVGELLGSEDQLRVEYGVSRGTLREALRVLEAEAFVSVRRGPGGGVFVRVPPSSVAGAALVPHFLLAGADAEDVDEARALLASLQALPGYQGNLALSLLSDVLATSAASMPAGRRRRVRAA